VIIGTTPLGSWVSPRPGTALVLIELGTAGLVAAGIGESLVGTAAPWALLAVVLLGFALRAVDLESGALFIPGGLYGIAGHGFGKRTATFAASVLLLDYAILGAFAASAAGHSFAALGNFIPLTVPRHFALDDISTTVAVVLIGAVWWWLREGRQLSNQIVTRTVGAAVAMLAAVVICGVAVMAWRHQIPASLPESLRSEHLSVRAILVALGACLFASGSAEALSQAGPDVPPPRIRHLREAARLANAYSIVMAAGVAFLFVSLLPADARAVWHDAPVPGVMVFAASERWIAQPLLVIVAFGSLLFLGLVVHRSAANAQRLLLRLSEDGLLIETLRAPHPRFGTPSRLISLVAISQLVILLAGAGQLSWLARAYSFAVAAGALLKVATLVRLRAGRPIPPAFRVSFNPRIAGRERPLGLIAIAASIGIPAGSLVGAADPAALTAAVLLLAVVALLTASERTSTASASAAPVRDFDLMATPAIDVAQVDVRPGNLLVPIRRPGALEPLAAALQAAGDRDVVVMTVRLVGIDASDDRSLAAATSDDERRLLSSASVVAERFGRAVKLLIVPGMNVFDAVAETVIRLRSSEVYVGESETLSADDQARLLGEAWERAQKGERLDVRLVIHHRSGRTAVYHLGAHAPTLTTDDLNLIHTLWRDASRAVGPHVHHRDVVRAALTHMQDELRNEGPPRDAALDVIRRTAHPADELASAVRQRDFARLRDMVRNRPPSDLASVFADLSLEDQVVIFRILPRKVASATFEYLSHDAQRALLKAMAQEDVAAILNNMAPDDRTTFLEELPAAATQQLLTLLTPDERAVAATLLGYPPNSIGRLMTPDYIAVREQWTVQEVLDYIRSHGQDSETLNVIYVVDDHGVLVDDIRIREFLLTLPERRVADLMDRRFVALNAADDQNAAVTVFRREDRSALPVTDSAGVLIGIVTIDDVLDVAEAVATNEIQRIGGSEALDEPYMRIALVRMIQKRAGWLTALFLGEMLTATAMGAFEHEIERAVVLALFVPLIISSGGNAGSQASTLVIRAIALGEVALRDWWKVMRREMAAGLALGSILGAIGFLRISIWSAFSDLYGPHWLLVAFTVGLALIGVVLWGTLIGSILPIVLRRLGFDPATSSAPFVATLVDVTGLVIYFSVGFVVLRGTLL